MIDLSSIAKLIPQALVAGPVEATTPLPFPVSSYESVDTASRSVAAQQGIPGIPPVFIQEWRNEPPRNFSRNGIELVNAAANLPKGAAADGGSLAEVQFARVMRVLIASRELATVFAKAKEQGYGRFFISDGDKDIMSVVPVSSEGLLDFMDDDGRTVRLGRGDAILRYNPEAVAELSDEEVETGLEHELWHACFGRLCERVHNDLIGLQVIVGSHFNNPFMAAKVVRGIGHLYLRALAMECGRTNFVEGDIAFQMKMYEASADELSSQTGAWHFSTYVGLMFEAVMPYRLAKMRIKAWSAKRAAMGIMERLMLCVPCGRGDMVDRADEYIKKFVAAIAQDGRNLRRDGVMDSIRPIFWDAVTDYHIV